MEPEFVIFQKNMLFQHKVFTLLGSYGIRRDGGNLTALWKYTFLELFTQEGMSYLFLIETVAPFAWIANQCKSFRHFPVKDIPKHPTQQQEFTGTQLVEHRPESPHYGRNGWVRGNEWTIRQFMWPELHGKDSRRFLSTRFEFIRTIGGGYTENISTAAATLQWRYAVCRSGVDRMHFSLERMPLEQAAFDLADHNERTDKNRLARRDHEYRRLRREGRIDSAGLTTRPSYEPPKAKQ